MRVLLSGANGFIGRALTARLRAEGWEVVALTRGAAAGGTAVTWDPMAGALDPAAVDGFDAVVHLAGEEIGVGRWTSRKKQAIRESRARGTRLLAAALAQTAGTPSVLVSASGINAYGSRGDEVLTEASGRGDGFLADVCHAWEDATSPASEAGIRVVTPRIAMVLGPDGGALARMLPLFRAGGGGPLGSGRQWWSWISRDDLVSVIVRAIDDPGLRGPVNAASPQAVTNREFTATLARVLHRPAVLPAPAFALRLALGQLAGELLLASIRVRPAVLERAGFAFGDGTLEPALRRILAA
ncbi:MAG: TIGR01777 family protein [Acidobacteria bacterium]|nr:TIGR01777 family protein [Acidobacteriota bacterium]